ncbi:hypothetical protein KV557_16150 [Kitasatospora aureofaciens]|uniref:hypothetical protein n=1 Tax=Kitasatospora aureofaciens TaxID=1894 RepID=UPI001C44C497|nr:hypothetical protein [Kitasatospora aureofaciens]MBV6698638.1 hypothetical protein [Kitasatospora aureofaciens]
MPDTLVAGLVSLLLTVLEVLAPLVGAVVAATYIRRRGRNARLAFVGCLVMTPGPIITTLVMAFGLEPLIRAVGTLAATSVLSAIPLPFHLVGLGLIVAGALTAPTPQPTPELQPTPKPQQDADAAATA